MDSRSTRWLIGATLSRPARMCVTSFEVVEPTHDGGIGAADANLAQALARGGHDMTLLFTGRYRDEHAAVHRRWTQQCT